LCVGEEHALNEHAVIGRGNCKAGGVSCAGGDLPVTLGRAFGEVGGDTSDLAGCAGIFEMEGIEEKVGALSNLSGAVIALGPERKCV
jgi:hypothetical protein